MYFFICFGLFIGLSAAESNITSDANAICKHRNAYYIVDGSCDSYIECKDYVATQELCPDGLHYNADAHWPDYPCGYPMDVPCRDRGVSQPAIPTKDCPHQYGFFPSPLAPANDCGQYRMCVEGRAIDMVCPSGLAFNPVTARCDWPDLVPGCNADEYLGFKCPVAQVDESGNPIVTNHKYEGNCYAFFSCTDGRARLLSCDAGFAFDAITQRCEDADLVTCDAITTKVAI